MLKTYNEPFKVIPVNINLATTFVLILKAKF
jgi:hypothetical protein